MVAVEGRKERVLRAVIDDYLRTGEPVGSRTVARKYNLGVSPATIRNEMADLEEMGYLEQPHTSAGRVPSDKGYRYHVDSLQQEEGEPAFVDPVTVRRTLASGAQRLAQVIWLATRLLAETTDFVSLASQPPSRQSRVCAVQLVPLHDTLAMLLVISDDGRVMNRIVEVSGAAALLPVRRASERIIGLPVGTLPAEVIRAIHAELANHVEVREALLDILQPEEPVTETSVVVGGATNLLKQPEFREVAKAQPVLAAVERQQIIEEVLGGAGASAANGVFVAIGHEIPVPAMIECSLISAEYTGPGGLTGRVGVLGPRRMDYWLVMHIVEHVAEGVTAVLQGER